MTRFTGLTFVRVPAVLRGAVGMCVALLIADCAPGEPKQGNIGLPPGELVGLLLVPETVSLSFGGQANFEATAELSDGGTIPDVGASFEATGGSISGTGRYTAGSVPGTYRVIASLDEAADTSTIVIVAPPPPPPILTGISLAPPSAALLSGASQRFTATGILSDGGTGSVDVDFEATGGSITANGNYTAGGTPGSFRVIAALKGGTLADTSSVTITAPQGTLEAVVLSPGSASLATGQTEDFTVVGQFSDGGSASVPVTWMVTGGTITSGGRYTAGNTPGSFRVIATSAEGPADTSGVTITAAPPSDRYFNSSEAGCGSDANVLWCDDFERGKWFVTTADVNNPLNAGWNGTPFGSADPQGRNFGRCGGMGVAGTSCAATNGGHTGIGQARAMADHDLSATTSEIYFRYYVKPLPGYSFGQEKALTFNRGAAGVGGIFFGTMFFGSGSGSSSASPHFYAVNQGSNLTQNQGNLSMTGGNWYFIELHLKLNGAGSDVMEMWMNNCGANGLGCSGTPTLRMRYTNATLRPVVDISSKFRSIWLENWANPASAGEMLYDQIKVSKVGPIGFVQ